ncbi:MAG: hypothetical protein KKA16_08070 [Alphaproteobacteria bacterium]|nr:hypothetical protein [Alphaproteobacteria bacterium]MBU2378233.1 hypothetical protein [Alphaproteobacteria bacterium]
MNSDGSKGTAQSDGQDLWALWNQLKRLFPTWSLIPSSFYTPGAWGYLGVDFVSGFRRNPSTKKTFQLLEAVDEPTFDALSALANLNVRRQDQMLRAVVLAYLTVPLSIAALLAEISGDGVLAFVNANRTMVIQIVLVATLAPLGYLMSHWRSRQIVGVLDLVRIERGQAPFTALELRED